MNSVPLMLDSKNKTVSATLRLSSTSNSLSLAGTTNEYLFLNLGTLKQLIKKIIYLLNSLTQTYQMWVIPEGDFFATASASH